MKPGYDARRRNRNIGTEKSGHGQDNRLTIPWRWEESRIYYEVLTDPVVIKRKIGGRDITFLVEPTRKDCCHCCTIDDLVKMLTSIPAEAQTHVDRYILRQPTRKQSILSPVWGRFVYWADLGKYEGPALIIEAQEPGMMTPRSRSLSLADQEELARLREDGHEVIETKRAFEVTQSRDSSRATQLYRTLPHEIGHNAHYIEDVENRISATRSRDELARVYFAKPSAEREAYAHRFADNQRQRLTKSGVIPFDRTVNVARMKSEGLDPSWFGE